MNPIQTAPSGETSFAALTLNKALLDNLAFLGYTQMMPIQSQSLPFMLEGYDLIAQAKTGSGKTVAFGLSVLNSLSIENYIIQALILCPTRELSEQLCQVIRQLARLIPNVKILNLSGGIPIKLQLDSLKHSPHIIVGTPGRIQKLLDKGSISLSTLKTLVLDEADRMLDMGFLDAIKEILQLCPKQRQTLLFSATYPEEIKSLTRAFMRSPKTVIIEDASHDELDIEQIFYPAKNNANKFVLLKSLLLHYKPASTLIFCNTKDQTTNLTSTLNAAGFSAVALNGDMEQRERDLAIIRFKNQSCAILVATDVAARGLDIKELPAVINYELAFEHDVHIHRIGRTGRAGNKGLAFSITTSSDNERIEAIEDNMRTPITWGNIEDLNFADDNNIEIPKMVTLRLNVGRKNKIRPGDILGALSKDAGLSGDMIGKIDIGALYSFVAVHHSQADKAVQYFKNGKVKGCKVNVKRLI